MARPPGPLLVFGPRSTTYDLGPGHPLTPRRFGPGIDLLRSVGAEPGLAPEPATDEQLLTVHVAAYLEAVRRFSVDPGRPPERGIGPGDTPAFAGMHEASAAVAGGSIAAIEAILGSDVEHAFHPGGGLHHAMPGHASGFCVYDDPALAIARARRDGLRVLYVDLDVHHGDGVQRVFWRDPGVLTLSIHESGRTLFPGTGFVHEIGEGAAAGSAVNLPMDAGTGEATWLAAIDAVLPGLAAAFGPDLIVSQHGADAHAWDPLAHLRVTTTAMGRAARLVDAIAHRHAGGRWLATGGGGYDVYRVVPRSWSLVWLAGAHREPPPETSPAWRARWAAEAVAYGQAPLPEGFADDPNAGLRYGDLQAAAETRSAAVVALVREALVPGWLRVAEARGWWSPDDRPADADGAGPGSAAGDPTIVARLGRAELDRLSLAPRILPPLDAADGLAVLRRAAEAPDVVVSAAIAGRMIVGLAASVASAEPSGDPGGTAAASSDRSLAAIGVAPDHRRRGLGTALLRAHVDAAGPNTPWRLVAGVADRDPVEPSSPEVRQEVALGLARSAGFRLAVADPALVGVDPSLVVARRP